MPKRNARPRPGGSGEDPSPLRGPGAARSEWGDGWTQWALAVD